MKHGILLPATAVLALLALPATAASSGTWQAPAGQEILSASPALQDMGLDGTDFWSVLATLETGDIPEMIVTAPRLEQPWDELTWTLYRLENILAQEPLPLFTDQHPGDQVAPPSPDPEPLQPLAACLMSVDGQLANCLRNARLSSAGCMATAGLVPYAPGRLFAVAVCTGLYEWEHARCNETARKGREHCNGALS
jgi:hypothetical protein